MSIKIEYGTNNKEEKGRIIFESEDPIDFEQLKPIIDEMIKTYNYLSKPSYLGSATKYYNANSTNNKL